MGADSPSSACATGPASEPHSPSSSANYASPLGSRNARLTGDSSYSSSLSTAPSELSHYLFTPTSPFLAHSPLHPVTFVDSPATTSMRYAASPSLVSNPVWPEPKPFRAGAVNNSDNVRVMHPPTVPLSKRRPSPLDLKDKAVAEHEPDAPLTSMSTESARSTISNELLDLSALRRSVQQNLRERPLSAEEAEDSDDNSSVGSPLPQCPEVSPSDVLMLVRSAPQLLVVDTRPQDAFLAGHLARSVHVSIPPSILNRFRKQRRGVNWASLSAFVTTPASLRMWNGTDLGQQVDVVVANAAGDMRDDTPRILAAVLATAVPHGSVQILSGGWKALADRAKAEGLVVNDEPSESTTTALPALAKQSLGPTQSFPGAAAMPNPPTIAGPTLTPMRSLPALSFNPVNPEPRIGRRGGPKLSLVLDGTANHSSTRPLSAAPKSGRKPGGLTIDVGDSNRLSPASGPMSSIHGSNGPLSLKINTPRAYGDGGLTPHAVGEPLRSGLAPSSGEPWSSTPKPGGYMAFPTSPGMRSNPALAPMDVSTILPSFLYLGPEISTKADVDVLVNLGVKRILNVAMECDDDEGLGLRETFERYNRIPMKDSVEESGVSKGIQDACALLDDARLHSAPVYVHCKAGKSRSVTVVLAYLIHANAWTLKTSYAYVAERRKGISPNIGFVAELIQFEESELGVKQSSGGVHTGDTPKEPQRSMTATEPPLIPREPKQGPRYTRESLPPEWGSPSMDTPPASETGPLGRIDEPEHTPEGNSRLRRASGVGGDIEVRKNGQWVHGRRAPVDRTTLQPGRRVSKAGLESMTIQPLEQATRDQ